MRYLEPIPFKLQTIRCTLFHSLRKCPETKVFAGGAVIARQSGANEVGWTTSDPVTTTTANLGYSAQLGNIGTTEETEPLGQKLRQHDPAAPPEPQPNDTHIGSADDPHWQCTLGEQFYGSFTGMPFHCQKAILQDLNKGLDEIFGFTNPHRPDNPTRVSVQVIGGVDSPTNVPNIPFMDSSAGKSLTNLALAKMLQSTAKPSSVRWSNKMDTKLSLLNRVRKFLCDLIFCLTSKFWWVVQVLNLRPADYLPHWLSPTAKDFSVVVWTVSSSTAETVWMCGVQSLRAFLINSRVAC